jgi:hypothetical protein
MLQKAPSCPLLGVQAAPKLRCVTGVPLEYAIAFPTYHERVGMGVNG